MAEIANRSGFGFDNMSFRLLDKGKTFSLNYDKLIISVGAYSNTFNTPGVKENGFFLKEIDDARRIRARILECKDKSQPN